MKLGKMVRDVVTGFEGVATAEVNYINGCKQYCVQPRAADGKMVEGQYIDHQRLEIVGDGPAMPSSDTGGSMRDTPATTYRG